MIPFTATILEAIEGRAVLMTIADTIRHYVVMTREQSIALALWVVHTHAIEAAEYTPYIGIRSAAKRSGKTTLLEVLALLVARPWLTGRISAAVLVRKTDKERPTLLLDESDAMFAGEKEYAEALRGILNTGFKASGTTSLCVGQGANITYKDFRTFSAKAIAGIGTLPDTVTDRAIVITLKRRARGEAVQRFRARVARENLQALRNQIETWAHTHLTALRGRQPALPDQLNDRAQDVWEPLLAIADHAGGDWPTTARDAAIALSGTQDDDDIGVELLADCKVVFTEAGNPETMPGKELVTALVAMEDRPWGTWSAGRPITQAKVARMLGGFGAGSADIKFAGKTLKGYTLHAFEDAWDRYLAPTSATKAQLRNQPNKDGLKSAFLEAQPEDAVALAKTAISSMNTGLSCGVAVSNADTGTGEQKRDRWAGKLPGPDDPPNGISREAWERHHVRREGLRQ